MNQFIIRMKRLHARLDLEVRAELKTRFPDQGRVARLKKLKLAIKDQLHRAAPRVANAG